MKIKWEDLIYIYIYICIYIYIYINIKKIHIHTHISFSESMYTCKASIVKAEEDQGISLKNLLEFNRKFRPKK